MIPMFTQLRVWRDAKELSRDLQKFKITLGDSDWSGLDIELVTIGKSLISNIQLGSKATSSVSCSKYLYRAQGNRQVMESLISIMSNGNEPSQEESRKIMKKIKYIDLELEKLIHSNNQN